MSCKRRWSLGIICVSILAICLPVMAADSAAEKLIGKVPGDPIMVVATSGIAQVKPAFDKTFLAQVIADKNVQKFAQDILNQGLKLLDAELPDPGMIEEIKGYVTDVAQCPILLGIGQLAVPQGPVPVHGYLYIDASQNKAKVQALLTMFNEDVVELDNLVEKTVHGVPLYGPKDDNNVPGYWGWVGDILVLGVNDAEGLAVKALKSGTRTKIETLAKLPGKGDAFIEYVDYEKLMALTSSFQPEEIKGMTSMVYAKIGVDNMKDVALRSGFDGANIVMDVYYGFKGPRAGLYSQMKPVSSDLFKAVPDKAMAAGVSHFDIAGTYDLLLNLANDMTGGQATQMVDMGVGMIMAQVGVDVREAIVKNLDGPMLGYSVPQSVLPDAMNGGQVGILSFKDADAFAEVLLTLEKLGTSLAQGQFQAGTQEKEGRTLHTWAVGPLAMMQVVPTWTVVGKHFVMSTDTNLCALAAKQLASQNKATSLLNSEGFKKASAGLPKTVLGLSYVDTPKQVKQMMTGLQKIWPFGAMMAGSQGIQLPMVLPSVDHLMTDLVPVCNYSVEKDGGFYGHYEGTGIELALGLGIGAGAGVAVPMIMGQRSQTVPLEAVEE